MIISKVITDKILKDSLENLNNAPLKIATYSSVNQTATMNIIMTLVPGIIIKSDYKDGDGCVYAIYEIGSPNVLKYIGSSLEINSRLKEHLVKNQSALSDGTFIKNNSGIIKRSKLANVYKLMRTILKKQIGYKVISVEPMEYYTAVESELIKFFDLKNVGWNKQR